MSLSLRVEVEVQRPAVLWSLVALVSVLEQQQPLWFPPRGVNISQMWRPLQGCLVGLRGGMGTSTSATKQLRGLGLAEVPSLSLSQPGFPLGGAIGLQMPPQRCRSSLPPASSPPHFPPFPALFLANCGWKA